MVANMFNEAVEFAKKASTTPKKTKAPEPVEYPIRGLEKLTILDAMIKKIGSIKKNFEAQVKGQCKNIFIADDTTFFRAVEGEAIANAVARKRDVRQPLSEEEISKFNDAGVVIEERPVPASFHINPQYTDNFEVLQKASAALAKLAGFPQDFIIYRPEHFEFVVNDETMDQVMSDRDLANEFFDAVANMVITPKMKKPLTTAKLAAQTTKIVKEEEKK